MKNKTQFKAYKKTNLNMKIHVSENNWRTLYGANINHKKVQIDVLISDKLYFIAS